MTSIAKLYKQANMFKQACWIANSFTIHRYLMSNADGRWDGFEKAQCHMTLCKFYVAVFHGLDVDDLEVINDDYEAIHTATQQLTDNLDEMIGFPLKGRPEYDELAPKFFEIFHQIVMETLFK